MKKEACFFIIGKKQIEQLSLSCIRLALQMYNEITLL